jgi:uncharacterized protein (DUF433 family)
MALYLNSRYNLASEETTMANFDRITSDPAHMNGEPCIRNLRLTVRRVLEALATYPDRAQVKREYPELEDEDIPQALAFAAALEASQEHGWKRDLEAYNTLLELWSKENPIKTTKLQVLLAVNGLLVSAISVSGGFKADKWFVCLAGAIFSFIWTFSIGRTALFQNAWQTKLNAIRARYPDDLRFHILDTTREREGAHPLFRLFGAISSKWYLLFSPFVFGLAWLAILIYTLYTLNG